MTREEAIRMLIRLKDQINFEVTDSQKKMDALNMAINALSENTDFWEKCPYYNPDMIFDGEEEYDMGKCKYKECGLTKENYERVWITDGKRKANILYDKSRQLYWMNCYAVEFAKKVLDFKIIDGEDAE